MAETPSLDDLRIDRDAPDDGGSPLVVPVVILLLLLAGGAAIWWALRPHPEEVTVATVTEATGEAGAGANTVLDASGYVTARLQATVSSKITAKVVEVLVEEGMHVEKGQILARLDDELPSRQVALSEAQVAEARSALKEIEVLLAEARVNLGRAQNLVAADASSQADLDSAQARVDSLAAQLENGKRQVDVAERSLSLRRQELSDTLIRAPFTGVAITKDAQPGEMISPVSAGGGFTRTGICTLVDMSSLEIEVDVNEAYINRVQADQEVQATLDAYPEWKIPARVITTIPAADRQKATVRVRIAFDQLDPRLLPDMGVKVSFLNAEVEPTAQTRRMWTVPAEAVRADGDTTYVLVVDHKRLERRAVQVGSRRGERSEIFAGVETGEKVVTEGAADLEDGQRVQVRAKGR